MVTCPSFTLSPAYIINTSSLHISVEKLQLELANVMVSSSIGVVTTPRKYREILYYLYYDNRHKFSFSKLFDGVSESVLLQHCFCSRTITYNDINKQRSKEKCSDLSWLILGAGIGFRISMDFSRILHRKKLHLRSKPCSAWNRPNRPRFPDLSSKGHRFCPAFWSSFWSFNTLLVKWRHVLTLLEKKQVLLRKNHGAWWKLYEIADPCSLFLFISATINCSQERLFGSGNGNTLGTLSIL